MAARKLLHYLQAHPITMVSHTPLADIINNRNAMGLVANWRIELLPLKITYQSCKVIKSQALYDFLVQWTKSQNLPM